MKEMSMYSPRGTKTMKAYIHCCKSPTMTSQGDTVQIKNYLTSILSFARTQFNEEKKS